MTDVEECQKCKSKNLTILRESEWKKQFQCQDCFTIFTVQKEEENPMVKLCDKISFIIFENVEKAFSEHMKEKDIKPTVGEPEGFGSYCAAKIIERLPRIFTEDYIIKKKEEI